MTTSHDFARYRANIQDEIDSAHLYRALADAEKSPQLAQVYRKLAATEEKHAQFWQAQLRQTTRVVTTVQPSWRAQTLAFLARRFGASFVLPTLTGLERDDSRGYAAQPEATGTGMSAEETSHAVILHTIAAHTRGGMEGGALAQLEGRHRAAGGNALRAAVLGANDGLVSNLSLIMGVAGAVTEGNAIVIAGLAGLLAGAASMAMGEWISVQSSRELYERQIKIEQTEIEQAPQEEQEELALIYQAKGLSATQAEEFAARLMSNHDTALDALSREELGIDPQELGGSALEAAGASFVLFAIGAIIPLFPFFLFGGIPAIIASVVVSTLGLFVIGAGITLMTGRSVWYSGMRQVIFGLGAAAVTFAIGRLIGVSVTG
ncbi:MAG: VIT1/CCC1 transporter family protein [Chloroflexi bacterium]|nr:VIT1/CCC1 transporter family protein [Chloroflexota bacterium]